VDEASAREERIREDSVVASGVAHGKVTVTTWYRTLATLVLPIAVLALSVGILQQNHTINDLRQSSTCSIDKFAQSNDISNQIIASISQLLLDRQAGDETGVARETANIKELLTRFTLSVQTEIRRNC